VELSADAVPVLADAYQDPAYRAEDRESIGAVLACRQFYQDPSTGWRSYHLSEARARQSLQALDLSDYKVQSGDHVPYILLNGAEFYCISNFMD